MHLHHTGRPRQSEWRGHSSLQAIWYTHTRQLGWSDLAQHLTIAPDGCAWTGRDWNRPPCSAPGQDGTRGEGPFMVTLVGDFNSGRDRCEGDQYTQLVNVIALLQQRFEFGDDAVHLHREIDPRPSIQCPGDSIVQSQLRKAVAERLKALKEPPVASPAKAVPQPFGEDAEAWYQFITCCNHHRGRLADESPRVASESIDLLGSCAPRER